MKLIYYFILMIITIPCLNAQGEFVVEYDLENGTFQKVSQKIDDVEYISPGYNTYNENSGIFYFVSASPKKGIYAIDTDSGEELYFHLANDLRAIEYCHALDQLFCIRSDQSIDMKFLSTVDLESGQVTDISAPIESSAMYQGYDTFSEKDTIYTFRAPNNILYSIHAVTGDILHQPKIQTQTGEAVQHLEYYHETGELYSLISIGSGSGVVLATIDPETGVLTKSTNTHFDLDIGGSSAMDQTNGYYIYKNRGGGKDHVTALDITNGAIVFTQLFDWETQDNLIDIEYDNNKQKLYSKHWDSMITAINETPNNDLQITPNPASGFVSINNLSLGDDDFYFDLYDNAGRTIISRQKIISTDILLPEITNGLYFMSVHSNNQTYYNTRLLIQN